MATIADIYNEIDTNPLTISRTVDQDAGAYIVLRIVYIIDTVENEARETSVVIHVDDRGGAGEAAYYRPKLDYLKSQVFKNTLITEIINFQGGNPNLEEYQFIWVSETDHWGIIKVWYNNAGQTEVRYYFLWEDGTSTIQFRQITNYGI